MDINFFKLNQYFRRESVIHYLIQDNSHEDIRTSVSNSCTTFSYIFFRCFYGDIGNEYTTL